MENPSKQMENPLTLNKYLKSSTWMSLNDLIIVYLEVNGYEKNALNP